MKNVFIDLFVELAIIFQKTAQRLGDLDGTPVQNASKVISDEEKEEVKEEKKTTKKTAKKTSKKTTKKTSKKTEETKEEFVFNVNNPPKGKNEREAFMKQWAKLGDEKQGDYTEGKIDSLGNKLAGENDDLDDDDFEGEEGITEEVVRDKIKAYAKENSKEEAKAILASFGAKKVADLNKEQYEEVLAEIE